MSYLVVFDTLNGEAADASLETTYPDTAGDKNAQNTAAKRIRAHDVVGVVASGRLRAASLLQVDVERLRAEAAREVLVQRHHTLLVL